MDMTSTPRASNPRRKFLSPCGSSPYRSPLINQPVSMQSSTKRNVNPAVKNMSLDDLRISTKELWEKNKSLEERIHILQEKGYKEEQLQWYIDKFHKYNEIKDVAQMVMGQIAILDHTTVRKVHEEFGMTEND